jgi:hypothetical protein
LIERVGAVILSRVDRHLGSDEIQYRFVRVQVLNDRVAVYVLSIAAGAVTRCDLPGQVAYTFGLPARLLRDPHGCMLLVDCRPLRLVQPGWNTPLLSTHR